jgi:P-type conjugative transfer protein TrbJ
VNGGARSRGAGRFRAVASVLIFVEIFAAAALSHPAWAGVVDELAELQELQAQVTELLAEAGASVTDPEVAALIEEAEAAVAEEMGKEIKWEIFEATMKAGMVAADIADLEYKNKIISLLEDEYEELEENYAADHAALSGAVNLDLSDKIAAIYGILSQADALTFAANADFERRFEQQNPGYRVASAGEFIDFSGLYRSQMEEWQDYAYGTVEANNTEALDTEALDTGIRDLQAVIAALDTASLNASGYRQLLQARNQVYAFVGQEVTNLRLDVARQIEARAKTEASRQQRRSDRQAAFEIAIRAWQPQTTGTGY